MSKPCSRCIPRHELFHYSHATQWSGEKPTDRQSHADRNLEAEGAGFQPRKVRMLFTKGKMQGCDFEPISKDRMTLQSDWASMHQNGERSTLRV